MSIIKNIQLPSGTEYPVAFFRGTCSTEAATTTKAVTCSNFAAADLVKGAIILVTFTNTNSGTASSLKMNVNSTGAKSIKKQYKTSVSNLTDKGELIANQSYFFQYDGTYWVCMNLNYDSTYSVYNASLFIQGAGTTATTFRNNQSSNSTVNFVGSQNVTVSAGTGTITITGPDLSSYAKTSQIPTVNNGTLTIKRNGTSVGTFTANQSTDTSINIDTNSYWIELT